jgi:hypothetical protein
MVAWKPVGREDVVRALTEYDRLGPAEFFSAHGFGPTTTCGARHPRLHRPAQACRRTVTTPPAAGFAMMKSHRCRVCSAR